MADDPLRAFAGNVEDEAFVELTVSDGLGWRALDRISGVWLPEIMSLPDSLSWFNWGLACPVFE